MKLKKKKKLPPTCTTGNRKNPIFLSVNKNVINNPIEKRLKEENRHSIISGWEKMKNKTRCHLKPIKLAKTILTPNDKKI